MGKCIVTLLKKETIGNFFLLTGIQNEILALSLAIMIVLIHQFNALIMLIIGVTLGLFAVGEGLISLTEMLQKRFR